MKYISYDNPDVLDIEYHDGSIRHYEKPPCNRGINENELHFHNDLYVVETHADYESIGVNKESYSMHDEDHINSEGHRLQHNGTLDDPNDDSWKESIGFIDDDDEDEED